MEWIDRLHGTVVGLDTTPLIYFIEEHPVWLLKIQPFFRALDKGVFRAVTSTVTLTEVLIHPFRQSRVALVEQYRQILLQARNLTTIPVTAAVAEQAAQLRAYHNLRTPDAIQLATALYAQAGSFVTNDKEISLPGPLRIIVL